MVQLEKRRLLCHDRTFQFYFITVLKHSREILNRDYWTIEEIRTILTTRVFCAI